MRKPAMIAFLIAALGGVGGVAAAPDQKSPESAAPAPDEDNVQITMTAGRGRLGVSAIEISAELRQHFGAPADRGVLVNSVRPDSPAARAGLAVGDVIVEVDGMPAQDANDVLAAMSDRKRGDAIDIAIMRANKRVPLRATLDTDPGLQRRFGKRDFDWSSLEKMPFMRQDRELRRSLEESRRRIEELERRLEKLERT